MEASVAAAGAAQGEGQGSEAQAASAGPDLGALVSEAVASQQQEMRSMMTEFAEQLRTPVAGEPEAQTAEEYDLGFLDDPEVVNNPQAFAGQLEQMIAAKAQQLIAPVLQGQQQTTQELQTMRREQMYNALVEEIPDFNDDAIAKQVVGQSKLMAEAYGWPAEIVQDPRLWRMVYLSSKMLEQSANEGDGSDPSVATLEGGGGARPASAQQVQDPAQAIVDSGRLGRGAIPF